MLPHRRDRGHHGAADVSDDDAKPKPPPSAETAYLKPVAVLESGRLAVEIHRPDGGVAKAVARIVPEGTPIAPSESAWSVDPSAPVDEKGFPASLLREPTTPDVRRTGGPSQVATDAYRRNWEAIFGARDKDPSTLN